MAALGTAVMSEGVLSAEEAEQLLNLVERHPLVINEKWYVVSMLWWSEFVRCAEGNKDFSRLPPIDNSDLCEQEDCGYGMKPNMLERSDYILVPMAAFEKLKQNFGTLVEERDVIERSVVGANARIKSTHIEVYPTIIKIARSDTLNDVHSLKVYSSETLESIERRAFEELKINATSTVQFYRSEESSIEKLELSTVEALSTLEGCVVVVDVLYEHDVDLTSCNRNEAKSSFGSGSIILPNGRMKSPGRKNSTNERIAIPGMCGLQNLGNTCFINSAVQCLSSVVEITGYFRDGYYMNDINKENVLGMQGKLAHAYAELIENLWSGSNRSIAPYKFKAVIGQLAPQFIGYSQHDSQELLSFVLDGLHEDLNRVKKKPHIEEKEWDGRPDQIVAKESWRAYKARNDSVVVDNMHGQLKSTVICSVCGKVSIKFDPFCVLSLPLPEKEEFIKQAITFVSCIPGIKWTKFTVSLTSETLVCEVRELLRQELQIPNAMQQRMRCDNNGGLRLAVGNRSLIGLHRLGIVAEIDILSYLMSVLPLHTSVTRLGMK
ncbi:unnamed protein product [Toxocara canis]|uniref:ubiquitinyl hydrolase 1 n=1 Tax=Toxocara canis TaxID=6265 RepID=A0A183UYT2_TOXCA|nr:unnamed protein product [Toxocara canis]